MKRLLRQTGICVSACLVMGWSRPAPAEVDFQLRVAPILQRHCLGCHNDVDRKGDFSLTSPAAAMASGVIEPGDAGASHLVDVITPVDGTAEMPKDAEPLSATEIEAIRQWIDDGAEWPAGFVLEEPAVTDFDAWSYQPTRRPPVPDIADPSIRTPIDAIILEKLQTAGLSASEAADRRTMIRRLTFDLIGLPPTPEEVEDFVNDPDPLAYERLVDRLLASPHYGERWGRHWLDVVKYADTCGYDKDKLRPNAWPYRDYVIRSFNEDKPYARFVREQIAGDVLYPGTPDGILGLGFIAAGPWDFIGHVEVPESKIDGKVARNLDRDEMVTNTLNTFCSVTVQCARCHHHKFDPITQQDYYGLQSVFAAVDRAERPYDLDAEAERTWRDLVAELRAATDAMQEIEQAIRKEGGTELTKIEAELAELKPKTEPRDKHPAFGYHSAIASSADTVKWVQVDLGREVEISKVILRPCHDDFAGIGSGFGFPVRFRVEASTGSTGFLPVRAGGVQSVGNDATHGRESQVTDADFPNPGLAPVEIECGIEVRFIRVTATKLVERKGDFIFALAELQVLDRLGANVAEGATVTALDSIEAPVRWAKQNLTDRLWAAPADENALTGYAELKHLHAKIVAALYTPERKGRLTELQHQIDAANKSLAELPSGRMVYAAATDFEPQGNFKPTAGNPRAVTVLHRGNVTQPGDPAWPGAIPLTSESSPLFDLSHGHSEGARRAALAEWLTQPDHPLVWRSIVNRIWQHHFGRGLVSTPNDFGRMGQPPTHPELLDWLAAEFRDSGGSVKHLHRLIVTSNVYRQSSAHRDDCAAIDGNNRYLWRMNRRRLSAEEIRDAILAVSGRLNPQVGGPGYYLFELEKPEHSPHYEYHKHDPKDPASHRRAVYRFIVRSQPDPWMTTLDCADSSQSTPTRDETLTSLQALSLLNNRFNLAMAEHFAERLQEEAESPEDQIDRAVRLILGRTPGPEEVLILRDYAGEHGLPNLCRLLFNLSGFVFVD